MDSRDAAIQVLRALPHYGIEKDVIEKATAYLLEDPYDLEKWGGLAVDFVDAGKFFAADAVFRVAVELFPNNSRMWMCRGDLMLKWRKFEAARACHRRRLEFEPASLSPLASLGVVEEQAGCLEAAVDYYGRFLSSQQGSIGSRAKNLNNLGNCYRRLGRRTEADACYEKSLALVPDSENTLISFASFLYQETRYDRALELINRFIKIQPEDPAGPALRTMILKRPTKPETIEESAQIRRLLLRPSMNYGWKGSAVRPEITRGLQDKNAARSGLLDFSTASIETIRNECGFAAADYHEMARIIGRAVDSHEVPDPRKECRPFISYRRSSETEIAWVRKLATDLADKGYQVVMDEMLSKDYSRIAVTQVVGYLARCNTFCAVLTDDYARSVEPDGLFSQSIVSVLYGTDPWVFNEMLMADYLAAKGRMSFVGLWRSGTMMPSPFSEEEVLDVRSESKYQSVLRTHFSDPFNGAPGTLFSNRGESLCMFLGIPI